MTYDASGGHHFTYDAEGNILQVDSGSWTFVFDALNRRILAKPSTGAVSDAVFDPAGRISSGWSAPTTPSESHIYADGLQLAYRSGDGDTYFVHQNWMGTDRVHTDMNGATGATYTSLPFGDGGSETVTETYAGWDFEHFGFMDADWWSNTYHAQFRNYSESQARWLSPDPYDGSYDVTNPQSFNRYAYVLNNPLSFIDPLGLEEDKDPCDDPVYRDSHVESGGGWGGGGGGGGDGGGGGGVGRGGEKGGLNPPLTGPDWGPDPGGFGETLGLPANLPPGIWGIGGVFGMPTGCEFGACGGGIGSFQDAATVAAGAMTFCQQYPKFCFSVTVAISDIPSVASGAASAALPFLATATLLSLEGDNSSGKWTCTASCNLQGIGNNNPPMSRVTGTASGTNEANACLSAKRVATQSAPPGTYARHCQCSCSKR